MGKILIFGATGSVGVYTALSLKNKGYEVIAVGRRTTDNGFFSENNILYYSVDIKNKDSFNILPKDIDTVIHFAGAMPARMRGYDPYEYINSIIIGTLNVLEYTRSCNCNKIIFSQSIADILYAFGTTEPIDDDIERRFPLATDHSVYSISKNSAVNLLEHYYVQYGIKRFVLRLPTIYVYQPDPFYYVDGEKKWMGWRYIIDQAIKGKTLEIWGNPKAKKEMVYVKDFVQLVEKCVESRLDGGIYNVGCGNPVSIEEQIKIIAEVFASGKESEIIYCPNKKSSPQFVLSIEKARRELGYVPKYDFKALLKDFKKEMEEEPMGKIWGYKADYLI